MFPHRIQGLAFDRLFCNIVNDALKKENNKGEEDSFYIEMDCGQELTRHQVLKEGFASSPKLRCYDSAETLR
jgi:hypothetical protein